MSVILLCKFFATINIFILGLIEIYRGIRLNDFKLSIDRNFEVDIMFILPLFIAFLLVVFVNENIFYFFMPIYYITLCFSLKNKTFSKLFEKYIMFKN